MLPKNLVNESEYLGWFGKLWRYFCQFLHGGCFQTAALSDLFSLVIEGWLQNYITISGFNGVIFESLKTMRCWQQNKLCDMPYSFQSS